MLLPIADVSLQVEYLGFFGEPVDYGMSSAVTMEDLIPLAEWLVACHDSGFVSSAGETSFLTWLARFLVASAVTRSLSMVEQGLKSTLRSF